jgi:Asp-tRNA(Asn)/Glu-tRNA(Gln) amidotransferase A subunit family amidase
MARHAWQTFGAAALGRGIAAGDIDPVALCEVFLAGIAEQDPDHRIYARLMPDRARAQAQAAAAVKPWLQLSSVPVQNYRVVAVWPAHH